ncbi:MAG: PIN domain-containing protein [Deltaproteobacteria bacterium]|nr:PIN domain-containing protein [Deltaproteobacteria bacterium]MBW2071872.1 PIN domain-containing protein [Deltaproteobacteria bacterium]
MGLELKRGDIIFLDTAPFIYYFQQHPGYFPALLKLFDSLYETNAQAITSIITYIELTTLPAREGKKQLVRKYRDFLTNSENFSIFPLDMNIADHAVEIRAQHHFKTPDAVQLGTAVACGADYIITNDRTWRRFKEIRIVMVGDL